MPARIRLPAIGTPSGSSWNLRNNTCTKSPSTLAVENLDAPFIGRFLTHLEQERDNTPRSRNIRLAAIHSFFKYVALEEPSSERRWRSGSWRFPASATKRGRSIF